MSTVGRVVRIGCGAGFWGDSTEGPRQLVASGCIDYLVLDYLAEITMSILSRARKRNPALGYATDFIEAIAQLAPMLADRNIKVITNAGGLNPRACKAALEEKLRCAGVALTVGVVRGDDLADRADRFKAQDVREMYDGTSFPAEALSVNAYLGAAPIAAALDAGAQIVITGRCVDSALALGPLMHEFGWAADDYDLLAAGSLAGHVIECGVQATGGIVTDWRDVADDWPDMGFPIAECRSDGVFVVTKPSGTGGCVSESSVAEQIVYEIGDPAAYMLPDVTCDFRHVRVRQLGADRVEVNGARGRAPTDSYKVSVTYQDGFRAVVTLLLGGLDAAPRAQRVAEAILMRTRRLLRERGLPDYRRTGIEVLGAEANYGADPMRSQAREVVLKVAVHHDEQAALDLFSRECIPPAASMAQGLSGFFAGRPKPVPLVRLFSCLVEKKSVEVCVDVGEARVDIPSPEAVTQAQGEQDVPSVTDSVNVSDAQQVRTITVPLVRLAFGRSGDKGDCANIGVLARRPQFVPLLEAQLTCEAVQEYFCHFSPGRVRRFSLPGLHGFNFLMERALGGGGMASLRMDPQGKMLAQILMSFPIHVPVSLGHSF